MTNQELTDWWVQYGQPRQACFYPSLARRSALAAMQSRGLPVDVKPKQDPRPAGYAEEDLEFVHSNGWLKFWGIGGKRGLPETEKLPR